MKIIIDGDSCPVIAQTTEIAKNFNIDLLIVKNYNHNIENDYAEIVSVESSRDSADLYIVNNSKLGDIIITQDYGLAAMVISKSAKVINPNGLIISKDNIDTLLHQRFIASEMRRQKRHYGSKNSKRTKLQDRKFLESLSSLIECL